MRRDSIKEYNGSKDFKLKRVDLDLIFGRNYLL